MQQEGASALHLAANNSHKDSLVIVVTMLSHLDDNVWPRQVQQEAKQGPRRAQRCDQAPKSEHSEHFRSVYTIYSEFGAFSEIRSPIAALLHAALLRDYITAEEGDMISGHLEMQLLGSGRRDTELEVKVLHRGRRGQRGERNVYTFA